MTIFYRPSTCGMISFAGEPVVWLTGTFTEGPESELFVTDMLGGTNESEKLTHIFGLVSPTLAAGGK